MEENHVMMNINSDNIKNLKGNEIQEMPENQSQKKDEIQGKEVNLIVFYENDFNLNNYSEDELKIISKYNLLLTKYPKLIIEILRPQMRNFIFSLCNLSDEEIILNIIQFISINYSSESMIVMDDIFFEKIVLFFKLLMKEKETNGDKKFNQQYEEGKQKQHEEGEQKQHEEREQKRAEDQRTKSKKELKGKRSKKLKRIKKCSHQDISKYGNRIYKIISA